MKNKVLIISHLAMNKTNNVGKTMLMMFQNFDRDQLFQLYFNDADPDGDYCSSFFRITDTEMLNSLLGKKAGQIKEYKKVKSVETKYSNIHSKSVGRSTVRLLMRDIIWKIGRYDRHKLCEWVESFKPSAIFLAPGYNVFAYDIANLLSKRLHIPIILFLMDDYYFERKSKGNPLEWIRRKWIRNAIKNTIYSSKYIFSVSREMADDYEKVFNKKIDVLYTPYEEHTCLAHYEEHSEKGFKENNVFFYAGSLGVGRWKILEKLARILEKFDDCVIYIYASAREQELIDYLKKINTVRYGGFLSDNELKEKMMQSDVVVHVESFEQKDLEKTRYSVSTKIPECLASKKPFFVIGPKHQSSISYLESNKAAYVCDSIDDLETAVGEVLQSLKTGNKYKEEAANLLKQNHAPIAIHKQIEYALKICKEGL